MDKEDEVAVTDGRIGEESIEPERERVDRIVCNCEGEGEGEGEGEEAGAKFRGNK